VTLAIGLLKHRITVTIYESAKHFGEVGAGTAFGPDAVRAMNLIDPSVKAGFDAVATSNLWQSKKNVWFDFRYGYDLPATHPEGPKKTGDLLGSILCPGGQATCHREVSDVVLLEVLESRTNE
jgi:salicylate hydroxylase